MKINSLIIDSTNSRTDLCNLGYDHPTDKSPYNTENPLVKSGSGHRHPYTAVYDFIFSNVRYKKIKVVEIGVLHSMSMICWRKYFPNAELYGFEFDQNFLNHGKSLNLEKTIYDFINIKDESSINKTLGKYGKFDIVIDDSTHEVNDQIKLLKNIHNFINPGGIVVIEDIFRKTDESSYHEVLSQVKDYYSSITFVVTEHELKYSPSWDNDKLLILFRNEK